MAALRLAAGTAGLRAGRETSERSRGGAVQWILEWSGRFTQDGASLPQANDLTCRDRRPRGRRRWIAVLLS